MRLPGICGKCRLELSPAPPLSIPGIDQVIAVWEYDVAMARLIGAVKRGGRPDLLVSFATPLAAAIRPYRQTSTIITWVPASPRGRRRRGFDQGRILAEAVGTILNLSTSPSLRRSGRAQFGGNRSERLHGPRLRQRPDWARCAVTDQIILLDDVITTGASMATAAGVLRRNHPDVDVIAAAVAMKP